MPVNIFFTRVNFEIVQAQHHSGGICGLAKKLTACIRVKVHKGVLQAWQKFARTRRCIAVVTKQCIAVPTTLSSSSPSSVSHVTSRCRRYRMDLTRTETHILCAYNTYYGINFSLKFFVLFRK